MPRAVRFLTVLACALVAASGCGERPFYSLEWSITDTLTLAPGESTPLPFTATRTATNQGESRITFEDPPPGVTLTPSEFTMPEGQDTVTATPTLAVASDTTAQLQTVHQLLLVADDPSNEITSGVRFRLALVAPPAPQPDFSVSVEPRQVNLSAGQRQQVTVTVARSGDFTGPLTITLQALLTSLHADPLTLTAGQTTGTLYVTVDASAPVATPVTARFVATSADSRKATTGFTFNFR